MFTKSKAVSAPHNYLICSDWGHAINFTNPEQFTVEFDEKTAEFDIVGHQQRIPKIGDTLDSKFKSGTTYRFIFTEVSPCGNPTDMFFAKVKFLLNAEGTPSLSDVVTKTS